MAEAFMSQGRCPAPQCLGGREHSISCANYRVEMKIQVQRAENFDSISWWPKDSRSPGFMASSSRLPFRGCVIEIES
jgi:hypothetical protein